ncbi:MAG: CRISPR-associated endonuclease Cas2 [Nitrospirae bacterium]|nr:CRISPR-associated endonuclease Cas2 [Nitrospirota bacterium]
MSMLVVVSYDITDNKRRSSVSNELKNFGTRVQKSIFECHLNERQLKELKSRLDTLIDLLEDHVRFYYLCKKDIDNIEVEGRKMAYKDDDYFMI